LSEDRAGRTFREVRPVRAAVMRERRKASLDAVIGDIARLSAGSLMPQFKVAGWRSAMQRLR
jgi:hypothetical protein